MHFVGGVHAMPILSTALVKLACKVDAVAALVAAGADTAKTNQEPSDHERARCACMPSGIRRHRA